MNGRKYSRWPLALAFCLAVISTSASAFTGIDAAAGAASGAGAGGGQRKEANLSESDQLAIAALRSLMSLPPEQALPRIRKVLEGQRSDDVKARAVFVLSQIESPEASQLLADLAAKGQGRTQIEAIRSLGIRGDAAAMQAVHALVNDTRPEVRSATREAMIIANDRAGLLQIAKSATDEDDVRSAIEALGAIGGTKELRELADSGVASAPLMTALAISGDKESLLRLIKSETNADTRVEGLRALGLLSEKLSSTEWQDLYASMPDAKQKRAVLNGLVIASDDQTLLALYRKEQDSKMKREILRTLSIVGGDAALDAIDAAIEGQQP
ncbi:HEAT repeat domain-containing protein [Ahniella affigens]|nr:HEAT repeat domain-containing protein [Ahniella affigens]